MIGVTRGISRALFVAFLGALGLVASGLCGPGLEAQQRPRDALPGRDFGPVQETALLRQASALEWQGQLEAAEAILVDVLEGNPTSSAALFSLERILRGRDRIGEVLPWADAYIANAPRAAGPRYLKLRVLVEIDSLGPFDETADAWFAAEAGSVQPWREVARLLEQARGPGAALELLQRGQRELGTPSSLSFEVGDLRLKQGDEASAARAWTEVLDNPGADVASLVRRAERLSPASAGPVLSGLQSASAPVGWRLAALDLALTLGLEDTAFAAAEEGADRVAGSERGPYLREVARRADARTRPELALWALTRLEESGEGSSRSAADTDRMVATALAAGDSLAAIEAQLGRAQRLPTRGVEREQALARLLRLESSWSGVGAAALIARWTEFDREFPQSPARDSLAAGVAHALARREASDDALALLETAEGPLALEQRGWLLLGAGDVVGAKAALMAAAGGLEGRGTTSVLGAVAVLERLPGESAAEIAPALSEAHSGALGAALDRVARRLSVTPDSATSERATLHFVAAEIAGAGQDTASAEAHLDALLALPGDVVERPVALLALARMLSQRDEGIEQARAYLTQLILEHPQAAVVPEARRALDALGSEDQP